MYIIGSVSTVNLTLVFPSGSSCNSATGTFTINSQIDSMGTNCSKMDLAMDSIPGTIFTANYPFPNLECTVNFKCDAGGSISSSIVVVSNRPYNSWP